MSKLYTTSIQDRTVDSFRIPMNTLELACRAIDKHITIDNTAPQLIDLAGINVQGGPTASGLTDTDYPTIKGISKNFANINQLKIVNKAPLPPEIMEHFANMQCHCTMGLFPEINRAWLTIDSDIYVWTYEHGSDVAYFDGLGETIVSVGLVKPKSGVFHQFIKYLMILTTTVEIVVLGVTFNMNQSNSADPQEEITLVPEPIFVLPTDGVAITTIIGTEKGRIFLGGRDGSLFEIDYQAKGSWFGKRCKKINHSTGTLSFFVPSFLNVAFSEEDPVAKISVDNSRHILYLLTEKGSIEVYDLGENGEGMYKVVKVSQNSIVQSAFNIIKTLDSANFRPIVSISALTVQDSPLLHCVAVAETGVRFYFTTINLTATSSNQRPTKLQLIHVRLPPGFSANAPAIRPKNVHLAHYRENSLVMIAEPTPDQNHLWCISSDPFPFLPVLMEAYTIIQLDGPTWALQEVIPEESSITLLKRDKLVADPPLVVRQHVEPPRKFIILTAQGAHIIVKLRPVDLLREILIENKGPDGEYVEAFFKSQKEDQACATCLILACLESLPNMQIAEWATRAFFKYGGEPKVIGPLPPAPNITQFPYSQNVTGFNPAYISTPVTSRTPPYSPQAHQTISSPAHQMVHTTMQMQSPDNVGVTQMTFSAKHDGLYFYTGRILRELWNTFCCRKVTEDGKTYLISIVSGEDCLWILDHLKSLRNFLDKNTFFSLNTNISTSQPNVTVHRNINESFNQSTAAVQQQTTHRLTIVQDAQLEERRSLDALKVFVGFVCEVLGLWKILTEHQFHLIVDSLSKDHQNMLLNATFKDIFVSGQEILSYLIISLINAYLNDNASVDLISKKLREVCPNLYKDEDAVCSKANEILLISKQKKNPYEKEELLMSALNLCKDVAPNLNLNVVCQKFIANEFYQGVLELCVTCAQKSDDKNIGLHYYKSNKPDHDEDGYQAYARRMECYKEVAYMLDILHESNINSTENIGSLPVEPNLIVQDVINRALQYDDELLHITIYDWMFGHQMFSELITISNPSLEQYLIRATKEHPDTLQIYELLWKYYEHNKNHPAAAKVLNALATEPSETVNLNQRIEYLAHSVMCMRSDKLGYAAPLGIFLRELEDRIQIARVQQKILDCIEKNRSKYPRAEEAIKQLNYKLLDITDLYEQFAEPYELWECKLAIIHCSGHDDASLIQNIWENIISSEVGITQLLNKIRALAREYGDSENCFPLRVIINLLEIQCCKSMASPILVPETMLSIGIPYTKLIDTYKSILKERIAGNIGNPFHMFEAVAYLILVFTENPNVVSHLEKRKVITKAEDIISSALSSLYSKPNTEHLIQKLRDIQAKLRRIN